MEELYYWETSVKWTGERKGVMTFPAIAENIKPDFVPFKSKFKAQPKSLRKQENNR